MSHRGLSQLLGKLYQTGTVNPPLPSHQSELESRLVANFEARRSGSGNWFSLLNPWNRSTRIAMIGLAMFILGLGACTTSTTTEFEMGQKITVNLAPQTPTDIATINTQVKDLLATHPAINQSSTSYNVSPDGTVSFNILAWASGLNETQLVASLRSEISELANANITSESLTGTIKETLAEKFKRQVFRLEITGTTEEEIRAQIITQLAAQGSVEGSSVEVNISNGQTEINITVEEELED
jgi:hypothetical protein